MSPRPERLRQWFVAPPEAGADVPPPLVLVPPAQAASRPPTGVVTDPAAAVAGPARVGVVGVDGAAVAFGLGLAQRLARAPGSRTAVACVWGAVRDGAGAGRGGLPSAASRRLAAALAAGGHDAVVAGRVVRVWLPREPAEAVEAFAALAVQLAGVGLVTVLVGARPEPFDAVLAGQALLLAVVRADAPPALAVLAEQALVTAAPAAMVRAVALPSRLAAPARRAAVTRALSVMR